MDYNTETFEPLMEHEVNGLDYKYVYGNDRLSVDISPINNSGHIVENGGHVRLYYHMDYLGTADYLTSPVSGKVEAWTHYNEWGLIVHNAVLKCGQRELDLVKRYATHDYDSVLELYYAKARFYDAHDRRFTAVDPILDPSTYDIKLYVDNTIQLVQYPYVRNNPINLIDPTGKVAVVDDVVIVYAAGGAILTFTYAKWVEWVNSPQGQKVMARATKVVVDGITYVGEGISGLFNSVVDGAKWAGGKVVEGATWAGGKVVDGATWVGEQASAAWNSITSYPNDVKEVNQNVLNATISTSATYVHENIEEYFPPISCSATQKKVKKAEDKVVERVAAARNNVYRFFEIWFINDIPILGQPIPREKAVSRMRQGLNVITYFRSDAASVANEAGVGRAMHHQRHGGTGYFNHYHIINHGNSAHIFYIIGG